MNTLNPELHVAVLTRNPADPRIKSPASEQPRWDIARLQDRDDLANNTQLPSGLVFHGAILPRRWTGYPPAGASGRTYLDHAAAHDISALEAIRVVLSGPALVHVENHVNEARQTADGARQ
ncbi:hypothetical protein Pa4123_38790 [Phytohabitans aurantiacus]|uniref:Uncharacterized protein n=1 Tax=Phytohabitans aurantiacus TaxID=3016789 RepID=A0ABQ5QVZ1_9ACTN|nr:hypothetical protein Pa4123_38790 [Phytohabitans aurantiacus]